MCIDSQRCCKFPVTQVVEYDCPNLGGQSWFRGARMDWGEVRHGRLADESRPEDCLGLALDRFNDFLRSVPLPFYFGLAILSERVGTRLRVVVRVFSIVP